MSGEAVLLYMGIGSFIMGLLAHAIKMTWRLAQIEKELREDFDANIDNLQRDFKKLETGTMDAHRREFGETASAIRQKIHDIETWNRDTFVRKDSFDLVVGRIEKSMDKLGDRFEEKMDRIIERLEK